MGSDPMVHENDPMTLLKKNIWKCRLGRQRSVRDTISNTLTEFYVHDMCKRKNVGKF